MLPRRVRKSNTSFLIFANGSFFVFAPLLFLALFVAMPALAQTHTLDLRADNAEIIIEKPTRFIVVVDGQEVSASNAQSLRITIGQSDQTLAVANVAVTNPDFRYRFEIPGTYSLTAAVVLSDGVQVEKTFDFPVQSIPSEPGDVARGVLILTVAGGVLIAMTIGFIILLQGKQKGQPQS